MSGENYGFDPRLKVFQPDGVYIPKHMVDYGHGRLGHCCFSGCTPMGCPAGCCVQEMFHRPYCSFNQFRRLDEQDHAAYVAAGMRKHLVAPEDPKDDLGLNKEDTIELWRQQCAEAAAGMGSLQNLSIQDRQVKTTLNLLSADNGLMELVYEYGAPTADKPVAQDGLDEETRKKWQEPTNRSQSARRCVKCGNFVGSFGNGRCRPDQCLSEEQ